MHQIESSLLEYCTDIFTSLNPNQQLEVLSQLFSQVSNIPVQSDFLELANNAMCHLKDNNRSNIIYLLAKCVGTKRSNGLNSLLPVKRMPMELIEYVVNFFTSSSLTEVCCKSLTLLFLYMYICL